METERQTFLGEVVHSQIYAPQWKQPGGKSSYWGTPSGGPPSVRVHTALADTPPLGLPHITEGRVGKADDGDRWYLVSSSPSAGGAAGAASNKVSGIPALGSVQATPMVMTWTRFVT